LQEDEHHEKDEDHGLDQGVDDLLDGDAHEGGGIQRNLVADAVREALGQFRQLGRDPIGRFQGIGARGEVDAHADGRVARKLGLGLVVLGPEFHPGHIAQAQQGAVGLGSQNDVCELFRTQQSALGGDHVVDGHRVLGIAGFGPDATGGELGVLLLDGARHVGRREL